MRRGALAGFLTSLLLLCASAPVAQAATTTPTFQGLGFCTPDSPYGFEARVSGLEPNTLYVLRVTFSSGLRAALPFTTDSTGSQDRLAGAARAEPFEFRVTIFADPNGNLSQDPGEAIVIDREFIVDSVCGGARPKQPVAKEECKRDGWRNFGTAFKNEGQCVAFVQRRPKP